MRDPARIEKVLNTLKTYWYLNPNLRLGQIFDNLKDSIKEDIFYIEDDKLENHIKKLIDLEEYGNEESSE